MQNQIELKLRQNQHKMYLIILYIVVIGILAYTTFWQIKYYQDYGFFKRTKATIIEYEVVDNKKYEVIEYKFDGDYYQKTTKYVGKHDIGDKVTIYVDRTNPIGVIYKADIRRILFPVFDGLLIGVAVGFTILYHYNYNTMQTAKKSAKNSKKQKSLADNKTNKSIKKTLPKK